jgi:hypothetical protein
MDEKLKKMLEQEEVEGVHKQLLDDCVQLVRQSRSRMSEYYDTWDQSDATYRGKRTEDADDRAAKERKEPVKMVVPVAHAQINTFVAFLHANYNQRERFFELQGAKDNQKSAKVAEALLERDLNYNKWQAKLHQALLDIARFGLAVMKTGWTRETQRIMQAQDVAPTTEYLGLVQAPQKQVVEVEALKYLGNKVMNVSPYRFFPDTRLPISRFQEGEFCASEDEYTYTALKKMEKDGDIAGVKFIKPMTKQQFEQRGQTRLQSENPTLVDETMTGGGQSKGVYILTEIQRVIIPSEYEVDGEPLGEEDYPCKYNIWYVNDSRIVKCEKLGYIHDQFTYDVGQYTPDMHELVNEALAGSIDALQSVITWFINARVTNVRKVIGNQLVVDPELVNMQDVRDRAGVIRMKPQASRLGIDRAIKQLDIRDVTSGHVSDAAFLKDMVQETTGITENALGQFSSGRRSATEAKNVNAGATLRLKLIAVLLWNEMFVPMGEKMLSNLRQGLDEETLVKVVGIDTAVAGQEEQFLPVTNADILGPSEFCMFDGTLPTEKVFNAQVLQEVLGAILKNPQVAIALQLDPKAMLLEMMELRGIRNPQRFFLKGVPQDVGQQPQQPGGAGPNPPQPGAATGGPQESPGFSFGNGSSGPAY